MDAATAIATAAAAADEPTYEINTSFRKLANRRIAPQETRRIQGNLILSHSSSVGAALPEPIMRLTLALKLLWLVASGTPGS